MVDMKKQSENKTEICETEYLLKSEANKKALLKSIKNIEEGKFAERELIEVE
jgi:hypothetical protein